MFFEFRILCDVLLKENHAININKNNGDIVMDPLIQSQAENISEQDKVDLDDISGKIFIGGLSWQTTEANLRFYFEKYGELTDVALMMDKRTGKPRY